MCIRDRVKELTPTNKKLLERRTYFQRKINEWHRAYKDEEFNFADYKNFLYSIGYIVPEKEPFSIDTKQVDPEISKVYENGLADKKLKNVGDKLRNEFSIVKKHNNLITPNEITNQRNKFRTNTFVRNIYSEVLNILQAVVMNKISKKKFKSNDKKYLNDAMMTSIAGISAAMKNTG